MKRPSIKTIIISATALVAVAGTTGYALTSHQSTAARTSTPHASVLTVPAPSSVLAPTTVSQPIGQALTPVDTAPVAAPEPAPIAPTPTPAPAPTPTPTPALPPNVNVTPGSNIIYMPPGSL